MLNVTMRARIPTTPAPEPIHKVLTDVCGTHASRLEKEARYLSSKAVDTGRFRSGWVATQQVDQDGFTINLKNPTDYAVFVHEKNSSKSDTIVKRDIIPAMESTARLLAKDAAKQFADQAMAIMLNALKGV